VTPEEIDKELERISREKSYLVELEKQLRKLRDLLKNPNRPSGNLSDVDAVWETINHDIPDKELFTVESVWKELDEGVLYNPIPRVNVSAILSRFAKEGRIRTIQKGVGRLPSIYAIKPSP